MVSGCGNAYSTLDSTDISAYVTIDNKKYNGALMQKGIGHVPTMNRTARGLFGLIVIIVSKRQIQTRRCVDEKSMRPLMANHLLNKEKLVRRILNFF